MTGSVLTGRLPVTVDGRELVLFLGTTALAELQAGHGADFLSRLEAAGSGNTGDIPIALINAIVAESLRRFHADDVASDPYLVDDVILQNASVIQNLLATAFGKAEPSGGQAGNVRAARAGRKR